jgi:regulator of sigma E protease
MNTLIGIFLVLGVMILVHEWGHFVVARRFGVRVDVFSIGFGPRLFGWKRGATDYRISLLPLGGYVRMAGQDLSEVDSGDKPPTGAPDELMSKPRWQRALISLAGPTVNLIMPIVLLGGFFALKGLPYPAHWDKPIVISDLPQTSPLAKAGVKDGDQIVVINDVPTPNWSKAYTILGQLPPSESVIHFIVDHQSAKETFDIKAADFRNSEQPLGTAFVQPLVGQVSWFQPASRAGMKRGDLILSVNATPVKSWEEYRQIIRRSGGQLLNTAVRRGADTLTLAVHPASQRDENGQPVWIIGVGPEGQWAFKHMSVAASVKEASLETVDATGRLLGILGRLFTGKLSVRQLQSFVGIAVQAGQAVQEGPVDVINLMAMISLNLGILNLLPIPILDGGNILLLTMEGIRRRDFSMAFKERFVQVGLVFLLVLFVFVMYNDVRRLLPIHS